MRILSARHAAEYMIKIPVARDCGHHRCSQVSHLQSHQLRPAMETCSYVWMVRAEGFLVHLDYSRIHRGCFVIFTLKSEEKREEWVLELMADEQKLGPRPVMST